MSRLTLRLALLQGTIIAIGSCRDLPTTPAAADLHPRLNVTSPVNAASPTLPQAIDATIAQIFPNGHRTAVASRWRGVTEKLDAGQSTVARKMLFDLADWIVMKAADLTPPAGETKAHAAARLVLYMSLYTHRDPSQPMPELPTLGSDVALTFVSPTAAATVVTPDGKAGIALAQGAVTEPTVLVIYASDDQARARCAGPLDTELCQFPGFYHFELFPEHRLTTPARVGICALGSAPARVRIAHGAPSTADQVASGILADGIEILPAVSVTDFLPCGTGGLTLSFSEFNPVDPTPRYSRYCPTETDRTATYADLDSAITHVPESNIVVVCDGTWPTNEVDVNKAITIRSESSGGATLLQPESALASEAVFRINGVPSGEVRIAHLSVQFRTVGIRTLGTFDQITLDSVNLAGPGGTTITTGLFLEGSSVATAHVTVTRSRFTMSYYGVRQNEPVAVDTYDSHFEDIGWAGLILYSTVRDFTAWPSVTGKSMQKADVVGNTFINIPRFGFGAGVSIQAAGDHLIQGNHFSNTQPVGAGIASGQASIFVHRGGVAAANTRPARIRNNVIVGHAPDGDPAVMRNWGVGPAIRVTSGIAGISDSVFDNSVISAYIGLNAVGAEMTAFDNTVTDVYIGVRKDGASLVSITRNDFVNYTYPIAGYPFPIPRDAPLPGNPILTNGSLACNWWGSTAAPAPLGPNVNPGGYLPVATQPIANTEVECNVSTDTPPIVRVCSAASGSSPTVPTIAQAIQLVASGGTVKVCDGTHTISNFTLNTKSVTIEGEGPGIPTLDGGGQNTIFRLGSNTPTSNAIILRKLRLQNAAANNINVGNNYGSLLVDQVVFHPPVGPPPAGFGAVSGLGAFQAIGSGITVQNSSFDGGDIGIEANNSPRVQILNSTFTGQLNMAIALGSGSEVTVAGNTIADCRGRWCVLVNDGPGQGAGGSSKLLNNTITVDFAHPLEHALNLRGANFEVSGNIITGTGGSRDPNNPATWPIYAAAIQVFGPATILLNGNLVSGTFKPLWAGNGVTGSGRDNVFKSVSEGIDNVDGVSVTRSDITSYATPIRHTGSGSLRCNWWGSATGPVNVPANISGHTYTPWATAPIANTQTACDPDAPPSEPFAYVTAYSNGTWKLNKIRVSTQTVVHTLDASFGSGLAITPSGAHIYVSGNPTQVVSTATNAVVASIGGLGTDPWPSVVTPNGAFVYVANHNSSNVSVISTATNTVVATVPVGDGPFGVAVTPNSAFVYVMNTRTSNVSVISTATNTVVATIPVNAQPTSVAMSPDGARAYVGHGTPSNLVTVISTATNTVVSTIAVGSNNAAIAITPDGSHLYVANERLSTVSVIATATNTVVASIPVGSNPVGLAITPDGSFAYVTNYNSTFVSVIATAINRVVASIPVGGQGGGVAIKR